MAPRPAARVQRWEIVIPGWVPSSALSLNGRRRSHWSEVRRLQREAKNQMIWAIWRNPNHPLSRGWCVLEAMERAQVAVTFVYPNRRRRDPDGLSGLAKPLLDALVSEGVLEDDDSEHLELTIRAVVERGVTETRITVEALP